MPDTADLDVSRETLDRLLVFERTLRRWNATINLIGPRDLDRFWDRHVADSLHLAAFLHETGRFVDLGSGAGFPGLVLAIATGIEAVLVEADQRKAAFLREAARATAAPVSVIAARAESCGISGAQVVTARALAPLPRLLDLAAPLLADDGRSLFLKGPLVGAELTEAERRWQMSVTRHVRDCAQGTVVVEVTHLRPKGPNSGDNAHSGSDEPERRRWQDDDGDQPGRGSGAGGTPDTGD